MVHKRETRTVMWTRRATAVTVTNDICEVKRTVMVREQRGSDAPTEETAGSEPVADVTVAEDIGEEKKTVMVVEQKSIDASTEERTGG